MHIRWIVVVIATLLVVACGSGPVGAPPPAKVTPSPSTPPPDPAAVIAALKAGGIPIGESIVYTADTDPNKLLGRPGQYVGKASFNDTRLPASPTWDIQGGGSIETFRRTTDLHTRTRYIETITQSSPLFAEYDYSHGLILLRVSHDLDPTQAEAYRTALDSIP